MDVWPPGSVTTMAAIISLSLLPRWWVPVECLLTGPPVVEPHSPVLARGDEQIFMQRDSFDETSACFGLSWIAIGRPSSPTADDRARGPGLLESPTSSRSCSSTTAITARGQGRRTAPHLRAVSLRPRRVQGRAQRRRRRKIERPAGRRPCPADASHVVLSSSVWFDPQRSRAPVPLAVIEQVIGTARGPDLRLVDQCRRLESIWTSRYGGNVFDVARSPSQRIV